MGKPRIEGDLTARLPIAGLWQAPPQAQRARARKAAGAEDEHKLDKSEAAFELKADGQGRRGRRRAVRSRADVRAGWPAADHHRRSCGPTGARSSALDMNLASRWLDLDRITGATEQTRPAREHRQVRGRLARPACRARASRGRRLPSIRPTSAGSRSARCGWSLKRSADKLEIQELRVGLPGGSRGELQGTIFGLPARLWSSTAVWRCAARAWRASWPGPPATRFPSTPRATAPSACARRFDRRRRQGRGARHGRQPVRDHAQRGRPIPLGGPARAGDRAGRPPDRCAAFIPAGSSLAECSIFCCAVRRQSRRMRNGRRRQSPAGAALKPTCRSA